MSTPIDLRKEFGHRWKIGLDEAARGRWSDPWNYIVLCKHGHICPWGNDVLAGCSTGPGAVANRLMKVPGVTVVQDGTNGATVTFPVSRLVAVAKVLKPRRARRASEAQLIALTSGRLRRKQSAQPRSRAVR